MDRRPYRSESLSVIRALGAQSYCSCIVYDKWSRSCVPYRIHKVGYGFVLTDITMSALPSEEELTATLDAVLESGPKNSYIRSLKLNVVRALCERLDLKVTPTGRAGRIIRGDYASAVEAYVRVHRSQSVPTNHLAVEGPTIKASYKAQGEQEQEQCQLWCGTLNQGCA